jgi:S-adenosylmethionine:tRNA ribosyltransferase-isomerase
MTIEATEAVGDRRRRSDDFDYELPRELIAERPVVPRDAARLLEVGERLRDLSVRHLPALLRPGDVLVYNDTRVIPARLTGRRAPDTNGTRPTTRGEAKVEVTLHKEVAENAWRAFARPARRLRLGDRIAFAHDFSAVVAAKGSQGEVTLHFNVSGRALSDALARFGAAPLPPYIPRPAGPDERDKTDYQTMFAQMPGAVAAPTAGLHFTPELMARIKRRGVRPVAVTLHVGAGTFAPVRAEFVRDHRMHAEAGVVSPEAAGIVNAARAEGGRVVAVGSTSLRLLETAADAGGTLRAFHGETDLFIAPGYRFKVVDLLITNFHLPKSTLFMLVCAFAGTERMKGAYEHAKAERYRFYSYGDCCLIHRAEAA